MRSIANWLILTLVVISFGINVMLWHFVRNHQIASEIKIGELEGRVKILEAGVKTMESIFENRFKNIEAVLFVELIPDIENKKRPITSSEAWQRNWYAKHTKQLSSIEKRLMRLEAR